LDEPVEGLGKGVLNVSALVISYDSASPINELTMAFEFIGMIACGNIDQSHTAEAIGYRSLDR